MKPARLVQNFRGRRARILTPAGRPAEVLASTLLKLGLHPEAADVQAGEPVVLPAALSQDDDVVFIDGDMILPPTWPDCSDGAHLAAPCPVVGLVGSETPSRLRAMVQLGALAFLPKPVYSGSVFSALFLAVNTFNRNNILHQALADMSERRRNRIHVMKAVAMLIRTRGLHEEDAYELLRRESMRNRVSIEEFCRKLMQAEQEGDLALLAMNKRWRA